MSDIAALTARIEKLEHELAIQQDIHQVRRLHYTYGYFIDKSMYNEMVDLFADDGEVWFLGGIFRGKAGVRRLYIGRFQTRFTEGHNGPRYGWLLDHPQMQMVIDVAPDRRTAQARGRSTMQAGLHLPIRVLSLPIRVLSLPIQAHLLGLIRGRFRQMSVKLQHLPVAALMHHSMR